MTVLMSMLQQPLVGAVVLLTGQVWLAACFLSLAGPSSKYGGLAWTWATDARSGHQMQEVNEI